MKGGFTLIELLVTIAIVGVLAAVLIPNLLSARARSFDTAVQTCLKEVAYRQESIASDSPFVYASGFDPSVLVSCSTVTITDATVSDTAFYYEALHPQGLSTYSVGSGTSVTKVGP